ncbi:hypothetical protein TVAG_165320 [Trichomonas vaginalis G3]|uniref:Uncharacterized protein n=1 Tax=Trichomonas vaginalis (strain ATCC PRA-98 / G3) TaxID=412133 RepID=A2DUL3_TRIV3|nr:hypothetical protein TVAGG3_0662940 [Trichomonas vaginalis G3]EAY15904.1 hypothetical protein TVAG_165320 [Trichomonas vaginalis G3]KAI5506635.1 hypothetical protein TVAGG3_0662940 [Trichomonas vaginalis G3]|eukprot:XP_001328127.1 hypothetical protein [Trichomonas vaginalis G3]
MKIIFTYPKKKRKILEIQPTTTHDEAEAMLRKEFQLERLTGKAKFVHRGQFLFEIEPFIGLKEFSEVIFYLVKPHISHREHDHDFPFFDLFGHHNEDYEEDYDENQYTEDEEDEASDNNFYSEERVTEFLDNGDIERIAQNFVNQVHLNDVISQENSIYNRIDEIAVASNVISSNPSNFVPLLHTHLINTGVSEHSDEHIFDQICAIMDVDNEFNEFEDEDFALVDTLTARQRSAVNTLLQQRIDLRQAVEILRRNNFDTERALQEIAPIEID